MILLRSALLSLILLLCFFEHLNAESDRLEKWARSADVIIVGRVVNIGKSPSFWSGLVPVFQSVKYDVEDVLKGDFYLKEIEVRHLVVIGGKYIDKKIPKISIKKLKNGDMILLFLHNDFGGYTVIDSGDAVLRANHEVIKKILNIL